MLIDARPNINAHPMLFYLCSSFSFGAICLSIVSLERHYIDSNLCCRNCGLLQAVIGRTLQMLIPSIYSIYIGII
jgi:hypothetical protein